MTQLTFSPDLQDIFAKGIREILPADQWPELFSIEGKKGDFFQIFLKQAEITFGPETASGIFLRGGWAGFKFLVRQHGKAIGIDSLDFRLQPPRQRLMDGLNRIIALLREWKTDEFITEQNGDDVVLTIRSVKDGLTAIESRIGQHFYAGLFQEYLYWAGGGKQYPFEVKPLEEQAAVRIQFRLLPVD
jgi:hypothetical protein